VACQDAEQLYLCIPEPQGTILASGDIPLFQVTFCWQAYDAGDHVTVPPLA